MDEEVWGSGAVLQDIWSLCNRRGSCVLSSRSSAFSMATELCQGCAVSPILFVILMHSRGVQSVQFVTSALHRCPLLMIWSSWICQAVTSVHWNSMQLNLKRAGPSRPRTQYFTYKCWIVSIGWYWGFVPKQEVYISWGFALKWGLDGAWDHSSALPACKQMLYCCGEGGAHLWLHYLGSAQKNKIMDKSSCNSFPLQDIWAYPSGQNITYLISHRQF